MIFSIRRLGSFARSAFLCLLPVLSGCGGGGSALEAPAGVSIAITAAGEITLSWDTTSGAESYNVYFASSSGVSKSSTRLSAGVTSTSFIHSSRAAGSSNFYVVTAQNRYGESAESAEVHAVMEAAQAPPSIVAHVEDGAVTLDWDSVPATTYNIYLASQSGVTSANYASLTDGAAYQGVTTPYTITGLANGTTYHLIVTGTNGYGESSGSGELTVTPAAAGSLTVSGVVRYEDKEYSLSGFTGNTTYRAVRFAAVEAVDASSGTVVASGTTDASGAYTLGFAAGQSGSTLYLRAITAAALPAVEVHDMTNSLFAVPGAEFALMGDVVVDISVPVANEAAGAFNILDVLISGAEFVHSLSGSYPPQSKAFWQQGNSYGTYYCLQVPDSACPYGLGIYVLNDGIDTDEFDDDVLWHEYGHFVASNFSKDDSPGGMHYVSSNDLDMRLSWSEGWGDFFPGAVKSWLPLSMLSSVPALTRTIYIDTSGGSASSFDFGYPPAGSNYYYASNEAAVAKVLHDLRITYGAQSVWDVFVSTQFTQASTPVNFELFRDGWYVLGKADITSVLANRSINYSADSYETGDGTFNSLRLITVGQTESHTLFGAGDVDYIAFNATLGQQYTVRTSSLLNGADTAIRVFAPDQATILASNDNASGKSYVNTVPYNFDPNTWEYHENGSDILGSAASFTATTTGIHFVEVKSSMQRPLSAGKYGNYLLTITSP